MMNTNGTNSAVLPSDDIIGNYEAWNYSAKEVGVVIVGGGVAGLTAAKTLINTDFTDFILLEADNRLGGRVRTVREGDILVEEGAEWIHGGSRNPLFNVARSLKAVGRNIPETAWDWRVRTCSGQTGNAGKYNVIEQLIAQTEKNGVLRPYYNTGYGQFFIERYADAYGKGWNSTLGRAWFHLLEKMINGEEGTNDWLDISSRDADQYVDYGPDHQWKSGYDTFINYLNKSIPDDIIRVSSPVSRIFWDDTEDGKVLLVTNGGNTSYKANRIIITASVGYLKKNHEQLFQPSLPAQYINYLNGIDLGVADKIQIGWPETWWGTQDPLDLLILWDKFDLPKEMEWLYGIVEVYSVFQQTSVLQMFVIGNEAKQMEDLPENTVKQHVLQLLSDSTGLQVPQPTFFKRSQWGLDPWKRGSYSSYITVPGDEGGLRTRDKLAIPLKNSKDSMVVLWAGEHTHNTRYGTVDGAMQTGEREANRLLRIMKREMEKK